MQILENMIFQRLSQMFAVYFAKVVSYDGGGATVKPLFKNEYGTDYGSITAPVYTLGSSQGGVDFPLAVDDIVLCLTIKKDISQADGEFVENKKVDFFHNLADTIVLATKKVTSNDNLTLSFGSSSIVISDDKVVINGNIEVNGGTSVTGTIEADGEISSMIDVKAGLDAASVSLIKHVHAGVQGGNSSTSTPTPST